MNWIICSIIIYIVGIYITYAILVWKSGLYPSDAATCSFIWPVFWPVFLLFLVPFELIEIYIEKKNKKRKTRV